MSDERPGPGGVEPREPRDLEDAGPALRITERRHPGGPAMNVYTGWGVPDIQGPTEDLPTEHLRVRGPSGRSDVRYGGIGVAVLLLVAAGSFWLSGASRGDVTLQSLGIGFVAVAAGVVVAAIYLSRAD